MRVYTLMENQPAGPGYAAEHGLSLYVQAGGRALLVDMGQGDGFLRNAAALGVDISQVEAAILTHGHYDHGGGLGAFYGANLRAVVYSRREAFAPHYRADGGYIGLDPAYIWPSRICWTEDETNLWPGAYLCTCNGRPMAYGGATEGMYTQIGWERQPDDFSHEQYLVLEEGGRRVVFSGCSHKGVCNIAAWLRPDVLIGGFHLREDADPALVEQVGRRLLALGGIYYTCHCTSEGAYARLKDIMGEKLRRLRAGDVAEI